jgi:DNA-binding CsgD family transcriptional regulator
MKASDAMPDKTSFHANGLSSLPQQELRGFAEEVSLLFAAARGGSFIGVLRRFLTALVPFDDLNVFSQKGTDRPQLMWSSYRPDVIRTGVRNYVEATYVLDPYAHAFRSGAPAGAYRPSDVAATNALSHEEMGELPLQVSPGEELGFVTDDWPENQSEVQIVFALGLENDSDICCQVGLYRDPAGPAFNDGEVEFLTGITPLVSGAFSQYWNRLARNITENMEAPCLRLLSPRERDVIDLVSQGFASAAISTLLQVTLETVKTHRKRAYRKLDISSQAELFALMQPQPTSIKYHA